ncbi:unnamed protein product [Candida verbasci]|uniref:SET domain-containing protein n=1 Tax=Candida verbasci TaxID=1227364 RepID=A0A9W4TR97_9ASCO|nr:unnamed protein product [Candida verbasci]
MSSIPGTNDELIELVKEQGIKLHPKVSIGKSELGGVGLSFNPENLKENEEIELLRIPKSSVFNINTLLEVLQDYKGKEGIESDIIIELLTLIEPNNETHIIITYFIAFKYIEKLKSLPGYIQEYLKILSDTFTISYPEEDVKGADKWIIEYKQMANRIKEEYECINSKMAEKFDISIEFSEYWQIYQAIRSRILEIPQEEEDGYSIDITLVPILDFVNHEHQNNAHFDIDKQTNDIILLLDKIPSSEKFEITINYSPENEIVYFYKNYGFRPKSKNNYQVINLSIREYIAEKFKDGLMICKWIGIYPEIQIIFNDDEVFMNVFNLGTLFNNLKYHPDWDDLLCENFKRFNSMKDNEFDKQEILEWIKYQELEMDLIYGVNPIGVLRDGSDDPYNAEDLEDKLDEAIQFVVDYFKLKIDESVEVGDSSFSLMIKDYEEIKKDLFKRVIEQFEKGEKLDAYDVHKIRFRNYRSKPREYTG